MSLLCYHLDIGHYVYGYVPFINNYFCHASGVRCDAIYQNMTCKKIERKKKKKDLVFIFIKLVIGKKIVTANGKVKNDSCGMRQLV